jgi:REP element-mobilizing transposase RayT
MPYVIRRNTVIAHHLVISGYGHWFANDLRGSGSYEIHDKKFEDLGPIHFGRKARQPSRNELREFFREAEARLNHPVLWFDEADRKVIVEVLKRVIRERGYTIWACAVLRDHVHLCIRIHRDDYIVIWEALTSAMRESLCIARPNLAGHPVWADRPYSVYLRTPNDVWRVIRYIEGNPKKHGLPPQKWDFVQLYDNWPSRKKGGN